MCLAVPMKDVSVTDSSAVVEQGGVSLNVSAALVPSVKPGDFVLVHAGFALTVLDEFEVAATIESNDKLTETTS